MFLIDQQTLSLSPRFARTAAKSAAWMETRFPAVLLFLLLLFAIVFSFADRIAGQSFGGVGKLVVNKMPNQQNKIWKRFQKGKSENVNLQK